MPLQKNPQKNRGAGYGGKASRLGSDILRAFINSDAGVIFTRHKYEDAFDFLTTHDQKVNLLIPEMHSQLNKLRSAPVKYTSEEYPFVLSAGERRGFSANTIVRNPEWRKKDKQGALRIHPDDAQSLGISDGSRVRVTTEGGTAVAVAEINETVPSGYISLPNGYGLSYSPAGGDAEVVGVAPNQLTTTNWKDSIAGTPWHKHVPAKLEIIGT